MNRKFLTIIVFGVFTLSMIACQQKSKTESSSDEFSKNWQIFSSDGLQASGETISAPTFKVENGYTVEIPATVMAALVRNDVYKDVFYGENLKKIPTAQFKVPWWYRKTFEIGNASDKSFYTLLFEGLNYKANIWLNGKLIASSDSIEGVYRMFNIDVTQFLQAGSNTLAVEVIPPKKGDLTIGFVDWNPWPPDNNMGLWRPVKLIKTGAVAVNKVFVKPWLNTESLEEATLTISAQLVNHSDKAVSGQVEASIEGFSVKKEYSLAPNEIKKITFDPKEYPELNLKDPKVWWPNNLGDPNLYTMDISAKTDNKISDQKSVRFGIREVADYVNENGHRGFIINGKKILIKGAGWVDDLFLNDSDQKVEDQVRYVKHMNLNTIRLEGFWGNNQSIYDYADEYGLLIMIGWSCQWEWEGYCGRPEDEFMAMKTPDEISQHSRAYMDQVEWLRNHPSVFLWVYGSDKLLVPDLETKLNELLTKEDGTRPILNSCGSAVSEITGPSGVKMNGPYSYVTPNYWYVDKRNGGAFGFNTETGPGMQPSPIESIKRMIPPDHLWPVDSMWMYHLGRNEFGNYKHWMKPFDERYGGADNVEAFAFKAQMVNYEAMRPMFEAFEVNRPDATGVIQWMLNSAWPGMLWQLYDWYLMPNGAFYAAKNACRPLNVVYNYGDKNIYLSNDYLEAFDNLTAEVRVFSDTGAELFSKSLKTGIGENQAQKIVEMPELEILSTTYFLDLRLKNAQGETVAVNFYWLSTQEDVLDYKNSTWFVTPNSSYADLTGINTMPETEIIVNHEMEERGDKLWVNVTIENPGVQLAFFVELALKDPKTGMTILPVYWDDNYVSLLPGEKREISGYVFKKDVGTEEPELSYKGWNTK
ncbi:MAG TPA: glycoside hydrolase family 2 TIM barrel-domain containing protein [Draconibacterium sp.]|nr:glycoside hydrolase family 2 TIM barrel-domain containing protein [Draconibacterium sp.]